MELLELFTDASKWTKGHAARAASHESVSINNKDAVCWCLSGAINKCYSGHRNDLVFSAVKRAVDGLFVGRTHYSSSMAVAYFNDHPDTTFEDIIRVIHRAEELLYEGDGTSSRPNPMDPTSPRTRY